MKTRHSVFTFLVIVGILLGIYSTHLQGERIRMEKEELLRKEETDRRILADKKRDDAEKERLQKQAEYIASLDPVFHIPFDDDKALSFDEALKLATYIDGFYDRLSLELSDPTEENMIALTIEVLPMFEYEGAVDKSVAPSDLGFIAFINGQAHNAIAGKSDCDRFVTSYRFANPYSAWYKDPAWPMVVIHELVHVQQGKLCQPGDNEIIENTAQIVTWEVAAGLLNQGNGYFLFPLVDELRAVALATARFLAFDENRMPEYDTAVSRLSDDPGNEARRDKLNRQWEGDDTGRYELMERYSADPLIKVVDAVRFNDSMIEGLALPPDHSGENHSDPPPRVFEVDDLAYFLANIEKFIAEYENSAVYGKK